MRCSSLGCALPRSGWLAVRPVRERRYPGTALARSILAIFGSDAPLFHDQAPTPEVLLVQNDRCSLGTVRPRNSYALNGYTNLRLGAELFDGNEECGFGQFAERDRTVLGVSWAGVIIGAAVPCWLRPAGRRTTLLR